MKTQIASCVSPALHSDRCSGLSPTSWGAAQGPGSEPAARTGQASQGPCSHVLPDREAVGLAFERCSGRKGDVPGLEVRAGA